MPGGGWTHASVHRIRPARRPSREVRARPVIRGARLENQTERARCANLRRGEQRQGQGGGDPGADPGGRRRGRRRRRRIARVRRPARARAQDPRGDPIARSRTRRTRDGGASAPPRSLLRRTLAPPRPARYRQVRARPQAQRGVRRRRLLRAAAHQVLRPGGTLRPALHARARERSVRSADRRLPPHRHRRVRRRGVQSKLRHSQLPPHDPQRTALRQRQRTRQGSAALSGGSVQRTAGIRRTRRALRQVSASILRRAGLRGVPRGAASDPRAVRGREGD